MACQSSSHVYYELTQIAIQVVISQAKANDLIQKIRGSRSLRQCRLFVPSSPPNLEPIFRFPIANNRPSRAISALHQHVFQLS